MADIEALRKAIQKLYGCDSVHIQSVPILESFQGKTVWQGIVEVFDLKGHPKAKRCYAWGHQHGKDDKDTRYVAVLELPPVDSPRKAVQVAIAAEFKGMST